MLRPVAPNSVASAPQPSGVAHAARKPSSIKAGPNHPSYQHGLETLPAKHQRSVKLAELRIIEADLFNKGLIVGNRTAGRKPIVCKSRKLSAAKPIKTF